MCSARRGSCEQGILPQINHAKAEIVAGLPVGLNIAQFFSVERLTIYGRSRGSVGREFLNFGGGAGFNCAHKHSFPVAYSLVLPLATVETDSRFLFVGDFEMNGAYLFAVQCIAARGFTHEQSDGEIAKQIA